MTTHDGLPTRKPRGPKPQRRSAPGQHAGAKSSTDLRCGCHRLLAKANLEGIELRCPRCKKFHVLEWKHLRWLEAKAKLHGEVSIEGFGE